MAKNARACWLLLSCALLINQTSKLMTNPDVEVIGMLPAELQQITTYSAGITAGAKQPESARAFIRHLAAPEATAIYKTKGLAL